MNSSPRFLSIDDVLTLHAIAIEDQGGDSTLRDRSLLESALGTPAQTFGGNYLHQDIPTMAAAYAFHICLNHPFLDGNKRAATAAMIAFLSDNGWSFNATADEATPVILQLASGAIDKQVFTTWARRHMREKSKMELRDFFARLNYATIAEFLESASIHDNPELAHKERLDTIVEAARAIPAIDEANLGAVQAQQAGGHESATILRAQSHLLTAIYRIAQDMGYEW